MRGFIPWINLFEVSFDDLFLHMLSFVLVLKIRHQSIGARIPLEFVIVFEYLIYRIDTFRKHGEKSYLSFAISLSHHHRISLFFFIDFLFLILLCIVDFYIIYTFSCRPNTIITVNGHCFELHLIWKAIDHHFFSVHIHNTSQSSSSLLLPCHFGIHAVLLLILVL